MTTVEDDLITAIDKFLSDISHQTIVGQPDVVDFTLDLRRIIKPAAVTTPAEETA